MDQLTQQNLRTMGLSELEIDALDLIELSASELRGAYEEAAKQHPEELPNEHLARAQARLLFKYRPQPSVEVAEGITPLSEAAGPPAVVPSATSSTEKICGWLWRIAVLIVLLLILGAVTKAHAQVDVVRFTDSDGNLIKTFGGPFTIQCLSTLTCTPSGSSISITAAAGGMGCTLAGGVNLLLYDASGASCSDITKWSTNGTTTITGAATAILDLSAAATFKLPTSAGAAPTGDGVAAFDSTLHLPVWGFNGASTITIPKTKASASHNFLTGYTQTTGVITAAQPACGDLSDAAASCNTDATNATNIGSGTLANARLAAQVVRTDIDGTFGAHTYDFSGVTLIKLRLSAGLTTSANGDIGYDTTNKNWHGWNNTSDLLFPMVPIGTATNGDCVQWVVSSSNVRLGDTGSACGSGSGAVSSVSGDGALITNSGATGAVTLTVGNSAAHSFWGNNTGSTAASGFVQPACADLSDAAASCNTDATNATNIGSGTLSAARLPATAVTAAAAYTSGDLVQAAAASRATSDSGIATANVVTAAANYTNGHVVQAAGANKTTSDSGVVAANLVVASSPGAGIAHFAGSTQTVTSSLIVAADITAATITGAKLVNSTVTATQLAAQYSKGSCMEVWGGSGTSFALSSGDDAISNNTCYNDSGVTRTITAVKCLSDNASNTTTVNPTFGSAGTGTTILSGALTCGSSNAMSSSGTVSNASWTTGSGIDPAMGGTLTGTHIAMIVEYTF